jgi:hypothetical protein
MHVQLTVLVPYSMAIASLWDGTMELMLYRRLNTSDSQGVCAPTHSLRQPQFVRCRLSVPMLSSKPL